MKWNPTRRVLLVAALFAALTLPLSAFGAANERPAMSSLLSAAKGQITEIDVVTGKALLALGGTLFIDVRRDSEWAAGHLAGANHMDRGLLEFSVEQAVPDKSTPIVVYCKTGGRSALAALTLKQMGYTNVKSMNGGFDAWQKAGYPVVM